MNWVQIPAVLLRFMKDIQELDTEELRELKREVDRIKSECYDISNYLTEMVDRAEVLDELEGEQKEVAKSELKRMAKETQDYFNKVDWYEYE